MNRHPLNSLAMAVIILALTSGARAYTIERISPSTPVSVPAGSAGTMFQARFGGLFWPYIWHEAQWYLDGQLVFTTGSLGGQTANTSWLFSSTNLGQHEVKVRAKYDTVPFGVHAWTDYLIWTVTVAPHPPTAARVSPDSPVTVQAGDTQAFTVRGSDPGAGTDGVNITFVRWYLDGVPQGDFTVGPQPVYETIEHTWSHTFDTGGTYEVEAVCYDVDGYSSPSGQAVWTVVVPQVEHAPSASIVSPGSSVTVDAGSSVTFEARGTDAGNDLGYCEVSLDGTPQTNASFSSASSGSTATWAHTFDTPGTYDVEFVPVDLAGDRGAACTWTVEVRQPQHDPSGTIVSPSSSVTVDAGVPVTFTLEGADAAGDLWLCEVSLNGVFQTNSYFSGSASGSSATWTYTFNAPGTYRVAFAPLDSANNYGATEVWTVTVKAAAAQAGLNILVIQLDAQGRAQGPLGDANVDLTGPGAGTATTGGQGQCAFTGLNPGTYTARVSKAGYYAQSRDVSLAAGETKDEVFRLAPESLEPSVFDLSSPNGRHFIEGMPGNLLFSVQAMWNGSPGSVRFNVAGTWHTATITDLGAGQAQANLAVAVPTTLSTCSELVVEVMNGEGERTTVNTGVCFYPIPAIISSWYPAWMPSAALDYTRENSWTFWDIDVGPMFSTSATAGLVEQLSFDPLGGTFEGSIGGFGSFEMTLDADKVELLGEARMDLSASLGIALAGCNPPEITPGWTLSLSGRRGIGAPVVTVIDAVFPPAAPATSAAMKVPIVGDLLKALKLRLFLIGAGELSGEYEGGESGNCFLGTTSISGSVTLGLEGQVVVEVKRWFVDAEVGIYAGVTGSPEFQLCPAFQFEGVTLRGYVGVFASAWSFQVSKEVGLSLRWGSSQEPKVLAIASLPESYSSGAWQPIGDSCLRWGRTNLLVSDGRSGERLHSLSVQGETSQETALVENVVSVASPAILSRSSERLILFCLQDPNKPWWAATDIGTLRQAAGQPWALDRIADDQAAEFNPSLGATDSGNTLAAWERISGDTSDANDPGQIAPHLEIVASWFDPATGLWSTPEQLTADAGIDCRPMPVAFGATRGILWIANDGGDANSADRLMLATWSGSNWNEPQTLWSAKKGLLDYAFVTDGLGEGRVVFAVDEDGDPNTTADCELHLLSTVKGVWQAATQLTSDLVEDAMPTLVAPNGVPVCVWSADKTLVYSQLGDWSPRQVYSEYTLANEAPSLDAVTMPGGAAIAYTVQGPNGVDIVASFYDADLDTWSLPRQLTNDEHAETSLSLACDGGELVIAYLKTQTDRTGMDVEIDGKMVHLDNVPQPGRTDLYVLRHTLANDLAVVSESMVVEPANPAPGTTATIRATIENRGDLPLQNVEVVFCDGDPSKGGTVIGNKQVISGTLIAGGKKDVSVSWDVPRGTGSHDIFVAVDPRLAVEDRDRSNNELSVHTVLPDLAVETCWSTEVSGTSMALTARVVNLGVIPTGALDVAWRLGSPDGEMIGTSAIQSLIAGGAYEVTLVWNTTGHLDGGKQAQVFAVVDSAGAEYDETNNAGSLAVFHSQAVSVGTP